MIYIYALSDSNKHFQTAIDEYIKRLGKSITLKYIKPSKKNTKNEIIADEEKKLLKELSQRKGYTVLLDIGAKQFKTEDFHSFVETQLQQSVDIYIIIGGIFGVSESIEKYVDTKISLSDMTFPHSMALLMILEQIYRSYTIKVGKKYHH